MYHDIKGIGYNNMASSLSSTIYLHGSTINHNTKIIRHALYNFCCARFEIGNSGVWDRVDSKVDRPSKLNDVNLWIDSSDFAINGRKKMSVKDVY